MTVKTNDASGHEPPGSPTGVPARPIPRKYRRQLWIWRWSAILFHVLGYVLTILGVVAGLAVSGQWTPDGHKILGAVVAVCAGLAGIMRPVQIGNRYWNAWRTLFVATLRYEYERQPLKTLSAALDHGEREIGDLDFGTPGLRRAVSGQLGQGKEIRMVYNAVFQLHKRSPRDQLLELLHAHPAISELRHLNQPELVHHFAQYVADSVANGRT